jgi:hypothetical protein
MAIPSDGSEIAEVVMVLLRSLNSQIRCAGRNEEGIGNGRLGFRVVD